MTAKTKQNFAYECGPLKERLEARIDALERNHAVERLRQKDAGLWKADPQHVKIIDNSLGWLNVSKTLLEKEPEITAFAATIRREKWQSVVLLGMGGSSLAPEVLRVCLPPGKGFPKLYVLDSTDPRWIASIEKKIRIKKTLFIFASKSGTTVEPYSFFEYFYERTGKNGAQFIAITDPGTFLEKLAREKNFRKTFLNPSDIGGRFSALSFFGMVPAALSGKNVRAILESAERMREASLHNSNIAENPAVLLGAFLGEMAKLGRDKLTLVLPKSLETFGLWIEQLVAESSGKEGRGIVPVAGEKLSLSTAYGDDRVFVVYKEGKKVDGKTARWLKTAQKKHPIALIEMPKASDIGAEFLRWEIAVAVACSVLGVNAFDQPNVQEAKDLTKAALKELSEKGRLPTLKWNFEEKSFRVIFSRAAAGKDGKDAAAQLAQFGNDLKKSDYWGLLAYLPDDKKISSELGKLRAGLLQKNKNATLFGFGPRYLHSTGQLHKGGANNGVFVVIACPAQRDLDVPGQGYSFGQLSLAQALGDFKALDGKERRAIFVELKEPAALNLAHFKDFLLKALK